MPLVSRKNDCVYFSFIFIDCDSDVVSEFTPSECVLLNSKWMNHENDSWESDSSAVQVAPDGLIVGATSDKVTPRKDPATVSDSTNPGKQNKIVIVWFPIGLTLYLVGCL